MSVQTTIHSLLRLPLPFRKRSNLGEYQGPQIDYILEQLNSSYLGLRLGRNVYYPYPRALYPSVWNLNVSRSGNKRSTGLEYVYDLSAGLPKNKFGILSTVASAEGIIAQFGESVTYWKKTVWRVDSEKQVLLNLNEVSTIFKVGKRQSTSNLREILNDFYDYRPSISNPTKRSSIYAQDPCLSIVVATTYGALQECFREAEVTSGFLNRWCFFISNQVKRIANLTPPDPEKMESLKKNISDICSFAESVRKNHSGKMQMDEEARGRWKEIYEKYMDAQDRLEDLFDIEDKNTNYKQISQSIKNIAFSVVLQLQKNYKIHELVVSQPKMDGI